MNWWMCQVQMNWHSPLCFNNLFIYQTFFLLCSGIMDITLSAPFGEK